MRIFFSAYQADYQHYRFPYQVLLFREENDNLYEIYGLGFLPFRHRQDLFYLSRSCRSNLRQVEFSSENRRVLSRTQHFNFKFKPLNILTSKKQKQLRDWARAAGWDIKAPTLKFLWQGAYFNWLLEVKKGDKLVSVSLLLAAGKMAHWGYFFIDPDYRRDNLAAASGLKIIKWTQQRDIKYVYLGTCYGNLNYKRNFPGLEFFNGGYWSADKQELSWLHREQWAGHVWQNKSYRALLNKNKMRAIKG